jgi:hypothetical protein
VIVLLYSLMLQLVLVCFDWHRAGLCALTQRMFCWMALLALALT